MLKRLEPTPVQALAIAYADKAALLVDSNERLLDARAGGHGYKDDRRDWQDGGGGNWKNRDGGRRDGGRRDGKGGGKGGRRDWDNDRRDGKGGRGRGRGRGGGRGGRGGRGGSNTSYTNRNYRDNQDRSTASQRRW